MTDLLHAFALPRLGVRGAAVNLHEGFAEIGAHQPYSAPIRRWLGEALSGAALLTTGLKFQGRLSLQIQGGAALSLLYAECTSEGDCRGIARLQPDGQAIDFSSATAGAAMAVTLEPHRGDRYQGIVPLEGGSLAESLEAYFERSEQLATRLLLAADDSRSAGLLLQRLPTDGGIGSIDSDGWNRCEHLISTVSAEELLAVNAERLIHRLFHQEDRVDRPPQPLHARCRCSREKVADVLRRIGRSEALAAAEQPGGATITCEFCGRVYQFDAVEVLSLFADVAPSPQRLQ